MWHKNITISLSHSVDMPSKRYGEESEHRDDDIKNFIKQISISSEMKLYQYLQM
jgi:hypothetical protein